MWNPNNLYTFILIKAKEFYNCKLLKMCNPNLNSLPQHVPGIKYQIYECIPYKLI